MKIFSAEQIRSWDKFTIEHETIASIDLMERAASRVVVWLTSNFSKSASYKIFCGPGNNGGDGLAIARMLTLYEYSVTCIIVTASSYSEDFQANLRRLKGILEPVYFHKEMDLVFKDDDIIVDTIFGSGLNRPVGGVFKELVKLINQARKKVVAIDMPSGLFCDEFNVDEIKVKADFTLTFQSPKLSQLLPGNSSYVGNLMMLDIGLHEDYHEDTSCNNIYLEEAEITKLLQSRPKYSHKGTFGKAMIIAGSKGSVGAAVLCASACYRSGTGLVYACLPACGTSIMQVALPEAIVLENEGNEYFTKLPDVSPYDCIGIGPGIKENEEAVELLKNLFKAYRKPLVIDAGALNLVSRERELVDFIPSGSILTPHPKEFERLTGFKGNDFERLEVLKDFAAKIKSFVILKGAHTVIATPDRKLIFNSTGNPGMATGGSGDVLTGILTGLLAQGYPSLDAAMLGVYMHGFAGDKASKRTGMAPLLASDIITGLSDFFLMAES